MTDPIEVIRDFYVTRVHKYGTTISGALFGLGWWFFADGVMLSPSHIGFSKVRRGCPAETRLETCLEYCTVLSLTRTCTSAELRTS